MATPSLTASLADATERAEEKASDMFRTGRTATANALDTAADKITAGGDRVASASHAFGDRVSAASHTAGDRIAAASHTASDRLGSAASYVRVNNGKDMVGDIESLIKAHPGKFLIGAVVLGFLAGRAFSRD